MPRSTVSQSLRIQALTLMALLVLSASIPSGPSVRVLAAAGDLDLTFGVGGKVTTDFGGAPDDPFSVAVKPDGKIVAAGYRGGDADFAIAQYRPDGSLDSTFGSGGKVLTDFFGGTDVAFSVLAQPDGKVVAAGTAYNVNHYVFALARYNPDGSLDSTFGSNGKVTTELTGDDGINSAALYPDGRIIAVGNANVKTGAIEVARYNPDGSLDPTFGSGGKITSDLLPRAVGVALQSDRKIVVQGVAFGGSSVDFAVARFNDDGSPDLSYGSSGRSIADIGGFDDFARCVAIQQDGKAVAAGYAVVAPGLAHTALVRYNTNGTLDGTFGSGGKVVTAGSDRSEAIAIQRDGKIVVVGTKFGIAVVRYNSNGSLDTSFGAGGIVDTVFDGIGANGHGVAIQPDRKIIAVGIAVDSTGDSNFALARYEPGAVAFDMCLQDDGGANLLQFSSITGEYQFTNCGGFTLSGTAVITTKGSTLTLHHNTTDRRLLARIDGGVNKGTASLQVFSRGATFTIADRNTVNNTCSCGTPGGVVLR